MPDVPLSARVPPVGSVIAMAPRRSHRRRSASDIGCGMSAVPNGPHRGPICPDDLGALRSAGGGPPSRFGLSTRTDDRDRPRSRVRGGLDFGGWDAFWSGFGKPALSGVGRRLETKATRQMGYPRRRQPLPWSCASNRVATDAGRGLVDAPLPGSAQHRQGRLAERHIGVARGRCPTTRICRTATLAVFVAGTPEMGRLPGAI